MFGKKELVRKPESGALTPWKPFRELDDFRSLMSSVLEDFFAGNGHDLTLDVSGGRMWAPPVDVEESDKEYAFKVELPGVEKDDFKVEIQSGALVISGERKEKKEEKTKNYLRHEQYCGSFKRAFSLPEDANAEGIKAAYKNGILTVTVQRSEKAKPKAIPVNVA